MTTLAEQKAALRARILADRRIAPEAGEALAALALRVLRLAPGVPVSAVWPLPGELDLRPLIRVLHARGHAILLPETTPKGHPLVFRRWSPGCRMIRERFGTERPDGPFGDPAVILVPLVAFDRGGNRLGYGGGYYDRTLAARPEAAAIGVAHSSQEVDSVPVDRHDRRLRRILTEKELIEVR